MTLSDFKFVPLTAKIDVQEFDCGEPDITNFLKEDAFNYQNQLMANTYLFIGDDNYIVAYFCISNDCVVDKGEDKGFTKTIFNRLHRRTKIPNTKRIKQYPAIKVGRLGVAVKYQGTGIAYELMDFIKGFSIESQKSACRFLLLDALNKERQIKYYTSNRFEFLLDNDENEVTRIMYYDMM
ncbi:MAG: hypothetical protein V5804_06725 [Mucilaginibacter sp.]|uniref:hypothetical protein n=1 Tax=Mucilaginibacter sp. TaxID=1882438 RepID=UPI0034E4AE00